MGFTDLDRSLAIAELRHLAEATKDPFSFKKKNLRINRFPCQMLAHLTSTFFVQYLVGALPTWLVCLGMRVAADKLLIDNGGDASPKP